MTNSIGLTIVGLTIKVFFHVFILIYTFFQKYVSSKVFEMVVEEII